MTRPLRLTGDSRLPSSSILKCYKVVAPLQHHRPFSVQASGDTDASGVCTFLPVAPKQKRDSSTGSDGPRQSSAVQRPELKEISEGHITSTNEESHPGMARTQSLRNIATKFEKLAVTPSEPNVADPAQTSFSGATEKVPFPGSKLKYSTASASDSYATQNENPATHFSICEPQNVSKDTLLVLYRALEDQMQELRNERAGRITKTTRSDSQLVNLIRLSLLVTGALRSVSQRPASSHPSFL
ncbi:hypothetical protein GCK32_000592 [Trichostrongylus colubriformis]|uniref:Uncharacterized protein n=1 Tax=Trichostrongylus colubriformis TaxID=6319 RepID=A0AAN8FKL8_TRICO